MEHVKQPALMDRDDVLNLLRAEIAKAGSQSEWARKSGVHRTAINAILKGRKKVQHKLIVALGLKKIEAYTPQS